MKNKTLITVATIMLVGGLLFAAVLWKSEPGVPSEPAASVDVQRLLRDYSPTLGPAQAPVTITEFLDPACETCAQFYPLVKQFLAAEPQRLRLVVRYAPLHPGSDKVVAALEAARMQDKYWPALEALLTQQSRWTANHRPDLEAALLVMSGVAGLDVKQVRQDMFSPEVARRVQQDISDMKALNVRATPEFFVNGQGLSPFGAEPLAALIESQLKLAP